MAETYTVHLKFLSTGSSNVKNQISSIGISASNATKAFDSLNSSFTKIAGGYLGFSGLKTIGNFLIDINKFSQEAKISLATMLNMNLGGTFDQAKSSADSLFKGLKEDAKKLPGETRDFIEMAQGIASGVLGAGGTTGKLRTMTGQAVTAGKIFGIEAGEVARDIQQAMMGTLGAKDKFSRLLLQGIGVDYKTFNKLAQAKRLSVYESALGQPAIKAGMKEFENSWEGVTSTFKSNVSDLLQKASSGVFDKITRQISKWNEWLEANPRQVEQWTKYLSDGLEKAWEIAQHIGSALKAAFSWIADNKELLLNLGQGLLTQKVGSMAAGLIPNISTSEKAGSTAIPSIAILDNSLRFIAGTAVTAGIEYKKGTEDWKIVNNSVVGGMKSLGFGIGELVTILDFGTEAFKKWANILSVSEVEIGLGKTSQFSKLLEQITQAGTLDILNLGMQNFNTNLTDVNNASKNVVRTLDILSNFGVLPDKAANQIRDSIVELQNRINQKALEAEEKRRKMLETGMNMMNEAVEKFREQQKKQIKPQKPPPQEHRFILEVSAEDPDRYVLHMNNAFNQSAYSTTSATPRRR